MPKSVNDAHLRQFTHISVQTSLQDLFKQRNHFQEKRECCIQDHVLGFARIKRNKIASEHQAILNMDIYSDEQTIISDYDYLKLQARFENWKQIHQEGV